jgi:hypothetical protein
MERGDEMKMIITEYELTDAEIKMLDGDLQVEMYERHQQREDEMRERIYTGCVEGNAPECPKCGNWNALLGKTVEGERWKFCRDCGWSIRAEHLMITLKEIGTHEVLDTIPGECF